MRAKEELPECPVATAVSLIGGKWKLLILRNLKERPWRFNELQRGIDGISQKVLTDSLRQMMSDGLAYRHDYHEQPPRVEYGLTELGTKMLVFTVEHPVFTAYGTQDWYYNEKGEILHFPVDNYYYEGKRTAVFLGEKVTKFHRTLTTYLNTLLSNGFIINHIVEPQPPEYMMDIPGMQDEMRRPMMLIVSANKKVDR